MAKKVVTLKKKRTKGKPLCYVDSKGNVRHRKGGRSKGKGTILVKKAVDSKLLKLRKAGKICLYLKGKVGKTLSIWQGKGLKLARKKRGKKKRRKGSRGRKRVGRPRLSARKKKSSRCPKTQKSRSLRAALACVRAGKKRTIAKRKVYNKALRRLRKSKKYRGKVKGKTLAKVGKRRR